MDDIVAFIDHGNSQARLVKEIIASKMGNISLIVDYKNSYLETIKEIIKLTPVECGGMMWICSSVCDYSKFEFEPPPNEEDEHFFVFPSQDQQQGDTFYFDLSSIRKVIDTATDLQRLGTVEYLDHKIDRLMCPIITVSSDTHTDEIHTQFDFPYAVFQTEPNDNMKIPSLWDTKQILVLTKGATKIVVPKAAQHRIKNELYDCPYIWFDPGAKDSAPLDIIFLSNGESNAEENYQRLLDVTAGKNNRIARVTGINGRAEAYKAAATESRTPWFFAVFAKLWVDENFDWNWQPDRLQIPKHYIFQATNPVNNLIYGHQAMIAYNKKLVLSNQGKGLDFTLDDPHAVVEILSGEARYATDAWTIWRTAFREAIKLAASSDAISKCRLDAWCSVGTGYSGKWNMQGAQDGVEYYNKVGGNHDLLRLSYEWKWLREKFNERYG